MKPVWSSRARRRDVGGGDFRLTHYRSLHACEAAHLGHRAGLVMPCPHCAGERRRLAFYQDDPNPVWVTCPCLVEELETENARLEIENVVLRTAFDQLVSAGYVRRPPLTPAAPPEPMREPL